MWLVLLCSASISTNSFGYEWCPKEDLSHKICHWALQRTFCHSPQPQEYPLYCVLIEIMQFLVNLFATPVQFLSLAIQRTRHKGKNINHQLTLWHREVIKSLKFPFVNLELYLPFRYNNLRYILKLSIYMYCAWNSACNIAYYYWTEFHLSSINSSLT